MLRNTSLAIHKEEFAFSAGHFTIFSATERETLHGHNYCVGVSFDIQIQHNGLAFDYRHYKQKIQNVCDLLDRHFLLPTQSPYLRLQEDTDYIIAHFNQQKIPFLKQDVVLLPLVNITIEELSHWFLQKLLENILHQPEHAIFGLTVSVYNGPGQSATTRWEKLL